jgi:excisionase family DNA binding protein
MNTDVSSGRLLTARQAAEHLAISTRTLWSITARGELPVVRIGRAVRYRPADLAAYVERLAQGAGR